MTNYTNKDIVVLSDRDYVRKRTPIYLGNTNKESRAYPVFANGALAESTVEFVPAVLKAISEIIDNCIDEFHQMPPQLPRQLTIKADIAAGTYTISDTGRGIPIDKHETGKYTPEVALASLKAGRNFTSDKKAGVLGQNGVGAACVNYCSTRFEVTIHRDGKVYHQLFENGCETIHAPTIKPARNKPSGTSITFTLDPQVFGDVRLPEDILRNRAAEIAATNPGVTVMFQNSTFKYPNGFDDLIPNLYPTHTVAAIPISTPKAKGAFYVIPSSHLANTERMYTWVNSSLLTNGGICNTQFCNALFDQVSVAISKKIKVDASTNINVAAWARRGLTILCTLQVSDPDYDSQAKTRLTGPNIRREIDAAIQDQWTQIAKKLKPWLTSLVDTVTLDKQREIDADAVNEFDKRAKTVRASRPIDGLLDASAKDRTSCSILITEGDSAKSQICSVRDPKTTAAFALTGKINNVYGATPAQVLKMGKVSNLLQSLGLVPSKKADRSKLRYGKIIIATDADYDGGDIFTLLVNLFYQFWPELFGDAAAPVVYRLVAPNICAVKGSKRVHFSTREEFEKVSAKYKGYDIKYYKGLGSMSKEDWKMVLANEKNLVPIYDDGSLASALALLFGNDAQQRQQWLQNNESN